MQGKRIRLAGFRDLDRPEGGGKVAEALGFMGASLSTSLGASVSTWASAQTPSAHTVNAWQHAPGCRYRALANLPTCQLANLRGETLGTSSLRGGAERHRKTLMQKDTDHLGRKTLTTCRKTLPTCRKTLPNYTLLVQKDTSHLQNDTDHLHLKTQKDTDDLHPSS
jgi:hypothetical protein